MVPEGVFPPALKNQLDKVLSGIKINNRQSYTDMKDYEKGLIESIYSVDQSVVPSAHMNTMPKIKYRQPPIRPALK